jgi:hypothetical protein
MEEERVYVYDLPFEAVDAFIESQYGSSICRKEIRWQPYDREGMEISGLSAETARGIARCFRLLLPEATVTGPIERPE